MARPDRRVRLGPQHALHLREGRQAARADRVVLPLPARTRNRRTSTASRPTRPVPRREARLHARRERARRPRSRPPAWCSSGGPIDGEDGETFRIKPLKPVEELRARRDWPPSRRPRTGEFRKPDLVDLTTLDPTIKLDIRYATDNNFLGTPFYPSAKAYMQRPAAEALARVTRPSRRRGTACWVLRPVPAVVRDQDVLGRDAGEVPHLRRRPVEGVAAQPRLRRGPDAVRPARRASRSRWWAATTSSPTGRTRTTGAARRCSAGTASSSAGRWRTRASPSTRPSGGTSTTRTGEVYRIGNQTFEELVR